MSASARSRFSSPASRIAVALDVPALPRAVELAAELSGAVGFFKVGLELFAAEGPRAVHEIGSVGSVFLDLKLHDIPRTMEGAARAAGRLGVALLTVHALAGEEAIGAAVAGAGEGARQAGVAAPLVLGVTVLTSHAPGALARVGLAGSVEEATVRLGALAVGAGAAGLVCSPHEILALRREVGGGPLLVVPGIRPAVVAGDDQARTSSAAQAIAAGADILVAGRPITNAAAPRAAALALAGEIAGAGWRSP